MGGAGLVETYRGAVAAWECDVFGHLNIAYYVERFADAALDLLERAAPGRGWRTLALDTSYVREFRAGEGIVIRSGILDVQPAQVRIAHEAIESASGSRTTIAEHVLAPVSGPMPALAAGASGWDRLPAFEWPRGAGAIAGARDRVRAAETDAGRLALLGYLTRFSSACLQVIDAIGMTHAYRTEARRGFATFTTRLAIDDSPPGLGDGLVVTSGVVTVGQSSLGMLHRLETAREGRQLARFYQAGVHFDLAARRSNPWPEELRARAAALRIAAT